MSTAFDQYRRLMDQGSFAEAARHAEAQLAGSESPAFWLTQRAKALVRMEDYREAHRVARRAMELEPNNLYTVLAAADALLGLQSWKEALPLYEELLGNPRLARAGRRGVVECLSGLQEWERILSRLSEWRLPEERTFAWRVRALKGQGRMEEALEICERWLEGVPDHPPALWERTELEIQRDGLEAVRQRVGRMARIPSLPQIYREIYASLCRRAGRADEAMKAYERIAASGAQSRIQKKQVFTMARSGREAEALPLLEEFLRSEPRDMYLHSSYAAACKRIGEMERAINFFHELLGLHPEEKGLYGRIKTMRKALEARK